VRVTWVDAGGAAELAGLRVGDVLLDFNGHAITDSDSLKQFLAS
jgi:S1-C subfamily serine protease